MGDSTHKMVFRSIIATIIISMVHALPASTDAVVPEDSRSTGSVMPSMQQEISQDNNNCVNTPMWVTYGSGAPADGWDCSAFDEHFCNENIGRCNDEHSGLCIDTGADKNCCACGKGEADAEEQQIASDKTAEEQVQRDLDKAAEQARLKVTEAEAEAAKKAFAAEKAAEEATQMAHAAAVEKGHLRQAQVVADAAQQRALEEAARLAEQKKKSEGADAAAAAAKKQAAEATKESEEADSAVATTRQVDLDTQAQQASQGSGLEEADDDRDDDGYGFEIDSSDDQDECVDTPDWVAHGLGAPSKGWDCSAFENRFCKNFGDCILKCALFGAAEKCCACDKALKEAAAIVTQQLEAEGQDK